MPALKKIKLVSPRRTAKSLWTFDTLNVKPGDTVRWETDGHAKTLFFPERNLFDGLAEMSDKRIIEINAEQTALQAQVKPEAWEAGKKRRLAYAVFHWPRRNSVSPETRGKIIIKRAIKLARRR